MIWTKLKEPGLNRVIKTMIEEPNIKFCCIINIIGKVSEETKPLLNL